MNEQVNRSDVEADKALRDRIDTDRYGIDDCAVTGVAVVNEGPDGEPVAVPIARFSLGEDVESRITTLSGNWSVRDSARSSLRSRMYSYGTMTSNSHLTVENRSVIFEHTRNRRFLGTETNSLRLRSAAASPSLRSLWTASCPSPELPLQHCGRRCLMPTILTMMSRRLRGVSAGIIVTGRTPPS